MNCVSLTRGLSWEGFVETKIGCAKHEKDSQSINDLATVLLKYSYVKEMTYRTVFV